MARLQIDAHFSEPRLSTMPCDPTGSPELLMHVLTQTVTVSIKVQFRCSYARYYVLLFIIVLVFCVNVIAKQVIVNQQSTSKDVKTPQKSR